jgi:PrsW family intramembrane metalloprotease
MGWVRPWKGNGANSSERSPANEGQHALNYQSFPASTAPAKLSGGGHRGFSTSINHMFVKPEHERVDCCALACCGVFQNDRDRFLITGIRPPSCCKRFWVHICLPVWIFAMAVFCAVRIEDVLIRELFSTLLILLLFVYFFGQCMKGMRKRREIRGDLLWSKYEMLRTGTFRSRIDDDSAGDASLDESHDFLMGQTANDIRNAHSLCGCYASDYESNDSTEHYTFCSRAFQCFTGIFCGILCRCHIQLCGICGIAQEGRQVEQLIHQKYRRVDYVTMQPMLEYYEAIYDARNDETDENNSNICISWSRLSDFSKWVVGTIGVILGVLFIWSILGYQRQFSLENYAVFCATLFQAYAVMKLVHWKHVKDISTDALIKYFVSGFCLSTSLAIFFELVVGLAMKLVMSVLMAISGINVVQSSGYSLNGWLVSPGFASIIGMQEVDDASTSYRAYVKAYGYDHPIVYTIYLFVGAFFLAAMIEEICKYFGFRMIEHPDFFSSRDLADAAEVESENNTNGVRSSFPAQDRSFESRGAAITVAMVATALGFACCENLVYIFIYGSSNFDVEVVILLARSIFPVHPIAAALQSIWVCERDLEKKTGTSLGRIIFPGILFHGLYDFLLMWFDFYYSRQANDDLDDDQAIAGADDSDWLSFVLSFGLLIIAMVYFFWASAMQRRRFRSMDRDFASGQAILT